MIPDEICEKKAMSISFRNATLLVVPWATVTGSWLLFPYVHNFCVRRYRFVKSESNPDLYRIIGSSFDSYERAQFDYYEKAQRRYFRWKMIEKMCRRER